MFATFLMKKTVFQMAAMFWCKKENKVPQTDSSKTEVTIQ